MAKRSLTGNMRLVGCFLAGIILYHFLGRGVSFSGEAAAFFMLLFLVTGGLALYHPKAQHRTWAGIAGICAVIALAFWGTFQQNTPETLPVPAQSISHYRITLVKAVALKPTSVSSVGKLEAVKADGKWYPAEGQVAVFLPRSAEADALQYGQQLLVKGALTPPAAPANPFQFDYRRYLSLKHINWQVYLPTGTWLSVGLAPPSKVVALSLSVRSQLAAAFKQHINSGRELTIALALVLGVQDDLDASFRNAYARTGTLHVLAVSGLHVGLLYAFLLFFLRPLRRNKSSRVLVFLVILGVVWFYAFVTGLSASVLRSVCMFSLVELGLLLKRKAPILNTLAVVGLALLLYEPNFLFDVGFQLSFLAVAGIVLVQPLFLRLWSPKRRVERFFWELLAISAAAQLATFPLSLYYFHQFPVYFWAANLVAVPFTTVGLYIGLVFMALFWVPVLSGWIGQVLEWNLWLLNEVLFWLERWPYAVLEGFVVTPGQVVALYLFVICAVAFLVRRKLHWLTGSVLCLAFISGTELAEAARQRSTRELVIHSARRSSMASFVQGREVAFLADSGFRAQPQQFQYQVQPYWWAKGVRQQTRFEADSAETAHKPKVPTYVSPEGNRLVVWQGKRLLWLKKLPRNVVSPVPVDALILQRNVWCSVPKLQEAFTTRTILLDQTNSRTYTARKATELRAAGYTVHVLETDGAWQIRL